MLKLFVVLLGGRAPGCQVELHDVVFVVGNTIEETYPQLLKKWFAQDAPRPPHIDAFIEVNAVDHHTIQISQQPVEKNDAKKLYFVNFGGYKKDYFGEVHETNLYVATSAEEALARAKKELATQLLQSHCDDKLIIDDLIAVDMVDQFCVHLQPNETAGFPLVVAGYRKLV